MDKAINDFVVFAIEMFKYSENLPGKEVYQIFKEYGVIDYLVEGYDVLHTQGDQWLVNDILEYLTLRGYKNKI